MSTEERPGQLFEAWGLIGMARHIAREGESDISNWARFEECCTDYFRRRDEEAPERPPSAPVSASGPSGVSESTPDRSKPAEIESGRFEIEIYGNELAITCGGCGWTAWLAEPVTLAELVQRAAEHAEVCK